jgi:N-acyl amino acid synthase of PEP-CTERM/exosortase system
MSEVYRLRYKVYCEEWGFEKAEDHLGGLEFDEYDEHSVHLGAFSSDSGDLIGTIRLILNSEIGFPIENHCTFDTDQPYLEKNRLAEISRLAVSKEFRKRAVDSLIYNDGHLESVEAARKDADERRKHEFYIIMGLYVCMYRESAALGLTHWYGLMAKGLRILLKRMNIHFQPIGPEIDHHGRRRPYLGDINEIIRQVSSTKGDSLAEYEILMETA